jgi:hypothetical protein
MATGVHDAKLIVERGRKLVSALEAGDGRAAFSEAGYGEGDHAQGQRLLRNANAALAEAERPKTTSLLAKQYWRAYRQWLEVRGEELRRDGLKALNPKLASRNAMDLIGRLRTVARGAIADENLETASKELKEWLDRWTPLARRVVQARPELADKLGVTAPPKKEKKSVSLPVRPASDGNGAAAPTAH